jgi:hypothetical protein
MCKCEVRKLRNVQKKIEDAQIVVHVYFFCRFTEDRKLAEISGSYGGDYEDESLLRHSAV